MTNFRHIRWANAPEHIAGRFEEYRRIMEHWRRVLPVLEVDYEETVTDLEGVARRLVDWCGLNWEPACLAFHDGQRPVRTASVSQVREPIYQRSVARWKNYERSLGSLLAKLPGGEYQDTAPEPSPFGKIVKQFREQEGPRATSVTGLGAGTPRCPEILAGPP
jgi:hypothetical protein